MLTIHSGKQEEYQVRQGQHVVIAARILPCDRAHAGVYVTQNGAWGAYVGQPDKCLCSAPIVNSGIDACLTAIYLHMFGQVLRAFPHGNINVSCTHTPTCSLVARWANNDPTPPAWYRARRNRNRAPSAMRITEITRSSVMLRRNELTVQPLDHETPALLNVARQLAEVAVQSTAEPGQETSLRNHFADYVERKLPKYTQT